MFYQHKKIALLFFALFFTAGNLSFFAQSAQTANRKTAVRYLKVSEQYAADKNWAAADANAELGIAYDDSISDLWYIRAVSKTMTNVPKYQIIPFLQRSLTESHWVDYNKESARVLYADILCSTREFDQALTVLDTAPFIYSSDAEYIRSKAYYNLGTEESFEKARAKIDAARRIYPEDQRFAELFFRYEYDMGGRNDKNSTIADAFIKMMALYNKPSVELEMYAALFAEKEKKIRMLKSFNARGLKSPLFVIAALEDGVNLLSEQKALDYFYSFSDKSIDYNILKKFSALLKDDECKREFGEYLNSYNGTIYCDTDGDLTYNLKVDYLRGRPAVISFDKNQIDLDDWVAECDFGVPNVVHLTDGALDVEYGSWPSVNRAVYKGEDNSSDKLSFNLVAEVLVWTPFTIDEDKQIKDNLGIDFYIPFVLEKTPVVSGQALLKAASSYVIPSKERKNAVIKVSVLDGISQLARYYVNDIMYAQTQFSGGVPVFRTVDMDGDGLFETTETYGFDASGEQNYISRNDEIQVMTNLFGEGISGSGFYVKMIQVDQNGDTVPDFTEEYTEGFGKISSWDLDNDGRWDVRFTKYPADENGVLFEKAEFYQAVTNVPVVVITKDGQPYSVAEDGKEMSVTAAGNGIVYWIGQPGSEKDCDFILKKVNLNTVQGVSYMMENEENRILSVRIGKYVFAKLLPSKKIIPEKIEKD